MRPPVPTWPASTPNRSDLVKVVDSLGNSATASVSVGGGISGVAVDAVHASARDADLHRQWREHRGVHVRAHHERLGRHHQRR